MRGYFGIGIYCPKNKENVGTLWRSAFQLGASFIFTIGSRYKKQCSDTLKSYRHIPLIQFNTFEQFLELKIYDCQQIIYIEFGENTTSLETFNHPERCLYLLGSEDNGFPPKIIKDKRLISIPSLRTQSFNVSVAGSIIMYDRLIKQIRS
jgi:tRNA G18 (ribose-2'-O)-methylase SpoU